MIERAWLTGEREIGEFIGVTGNGTIKKLVKHEGLPAKKILNKWRALPEDLRQWARERMNSAK